MGNRYEESDLQKVKSEIDAINLKLSKIKLLHFIENLDSHRNFLFYNFLVGLVRGFGMAVGFTLLGAILIYFLQKIVLLNIPVLGDFISDIVRIVQDNLNTGK